MEEEKTKSIPKRIEQRMQEIAKQNPDLTPDQKARIRHDVETEVRQDVQEEIKHEYNSNEFALRIWLKLKDTEFEKYILEDGEFGAFHIVARWMKEKGDYLWKNIAGDKDPTELYFSDETAFCAAVASKYIEGHMVLKDHSANKKYLNGMSVKEWCEKNNIYVLLENPESGEGAEGLYRLFHPQHFYHTIKAINSGKIRVTIDFEHMVSQALDPDDILPKLPDDFGKVVVLFHLGQPLPYGGTAHIPVSRGSIAQEQIYRWLYLLKKKGWKEGYVMFERGGGRTGSGNTPFEVFEDSVAALRQIVKYLEMDVEPKKLPPEFYGISYDNKGVFAKQEVAVRDHAWDPLEGVLSISEEKHTFLSGAAVQKGKGQEWEKRKYR